MEFLLTPHTKKILEGRGLKLLCSAPHCLHQPTESMEQDPLWGREIKVEGYAICPRCGHKTSIEDFIFDEDNRKPKPVCEKCSYPNLTPMYTQNVVSKHRKNHHYYYHAECYNAMFFGDDGKPVKPKKYRVRYAGTHGNGVNVWLPFNPRSGVCKACGKSRKNGEIKFTSLHHWKYAYQPSTVSKNPMLALENTTELCYACHQCADGIRNMTKLNDIKRIINVLNLMPQDLNTKFTDICNAWLKQNGKNNGGKKT